MNVLLDTHVLIWTQEFVGELGEQSMSLLLDRQNRIYLSPISTLEISRLLSLKQITMTITPKRWLSRALSELQCEIAPLTHETALRAYQLKGAFHNDPADRILVATAIERELALLTADQRILSYPHVRSFDAGK